MRLDKKRQKGQFAKPPPPTDRVRLKVPYGRRHVAQGLGARWDRMERAWWLPVERETAIDEAKALGFLPEPAHGQLKGGVAALPERVQLNVPYEQRDAAKRLGARWDPAERVWWLSAEHETAINKAKALGFLPKS